MEHLSPTKTPVNNYLLDSFSADGCCKDTERKKLEARFSKKLEVTDKFDRRSVSYQLSKNNALHGWLKYREGFSANLVNTLLDEMGINPGDTVLDPFIGSGTTALVCQTRGIHSIGYDILPIAGIALEVKSSASEYDVQELKRMLNDIINLTVPDGYTDKTAYVPITQDAYPEETEKYLQFIDDWREESSYSSHAKDLLKLCIINSLERCSYTIKSGQYLGWDSRSKKVINANIIRAKKGQRLLPQKTVRAEIANCKETVVNELTHTIRDIEAIQSTDTEFEKANIDYIQRSALFELPRLKDNTLDGVITSPPYCNRYDYTRTYALELVYLGLGDEEIKQLRQDMLSCTVENKSKIKKLEAFYTSIGQAERFQHIYNTINQNEAFSEIISALHKRQECGDLNNDGVLRMVHGYFTEIAFLYAELYRVCKPGAVVAFINDNVRYGGEVIPVDFLSSSFAEQFGFAIEKIYCLKQQKGNSSQQMAKYGKVPLRKSITIWKKR